MKSAIKFVKITLWSGLILFAGAVIIRFWFIESEIAADDPKIQYSGRIDFRDPKAPVLFWPGTKIVAKFQGSSLKLKMTDQSGENFYQIILDDDVAHPIILDCLPDTNLYEIASALKDTVHKIEIFRRTETDTGPTVFQGFILAARKRLVKPPAPPVRRLEFYGDSITSGLANECRPGDNPKDESKQNNYLTYGAITARMLNADYVCISKSGIGLMVSWFPLIMPQFYDRLNPTDPQSKWDFTKWQPDAVVVNLLQNDSWLVHTLQPKPDSMQIIQAYVDFVRQIRRVYPNAAIFCTLGNMDIILPGQPWPGYVQTAVEQIRKQFADTRVFSFIFSAVNTSSHPTVEEHFEMADELAEFIRNKLSW
ncbi:MAG: SGNH/GDSL hydrolase family protein [bacterium]